MRARMLASLLMLTVASALPGVSRSAMCPQGWTLDTPAGDSKALFHYSLIVDPLMPQGRWVEAAGPVEICRGQPVPMGEPDPRTGWVAAKVPVEIVAMNLVSVAPIPVRTRITESATMHSLGEVQGYFDTIHNTFFAQGTRNAFFDVFFNACLDPAGQEVPADLTCLHNTQPFRVQTTLLGPLPPLNNQLPYRHYSGNPIDLVAATQLTAARADSGCHKPFFSPTPTPAGCALLLPPTGGTPGSTFKIIAGNVSNMPGVTIASMAPSFATSCLTVGTWMPESGPNIWSATVTAAPGCTPWFVNAHMTLSNGYVLPLAWANP